MTLRDPNMGFPPILILRWWAGFNTWSLWGTSKDRSLSHNTLGWRWAVMHELLRGLFVFWDGCCLVSYGNSMDFIGQMTKGKSTCEGSPRHRLGFQRLKSVLMKLPRPNTEPGSPHHRIVQGRVSVWSVFFKLCLAEVVNLNQFWIMS